MVRDQPVGVLEFFATEPLAADEPMLRVMRHLGEQLGRVVERERAERRLSRHARELERLSYQQESILNSAGDGIYGVDKQGKITFINEAGARLVGLPRESLIGRDVDEVVQAELEDVTGDTTTTSAVPDVPAADVTPSAVTGRHKRADGDVFDSESINAPIVEDGDIAGSVVIFRDITEQRAVDRLKDEFISVVSHELRTPLTSIRGALGLLGGGAIGALPPTAQHMVGVATDSTDRLIRLINDILDIERMAAGKLTLQPELVAAADLVHTAVEETTGLAAEAGVTIRVVASEGSVWADTDRVVQTLTNLLGNAVKFSAPGSVVSVRTAPDRGHVRFDVEDEGRGIPQDQLEAVFGWFQQVDASDTRQQGGSGLGLAICRGIVEQRGGRIWATSQAGKGATFSFTLPVGVRRVPEPGDASRAEPIATVLVCDDDAEVVEVLVTLLETHGYRTLRAHDGAEVIELASRHTPSLLLLDLLMPGMSGKDALTELRSRPETAAIPVVVLSALSPDEVQVGPVAGWVTKPADLATLFAAVGDALATDESPLTAGID